MVKVGSRESLGASREHDAGGGDAGDPDVVDPSPS
jgi:hypothetical protein